MRKLLSSKGFTFVRKSSRSRQRGFTLIELLIVVSIIVIVIAVGAVSYTTAQQKARNGQRQADLQKLAAALEEYHADHGKYPDTGATSGAPAGKFETAGRSANDHINCLLGGAAAAAVNPPGNFTCEPPLNQYIANGDNEKLPIDPSYFSIHDGNANYAYATKDKGQGYILVTKNYEGQAPSDHRFTLATSAYYWGLAGTSPWPAELQDGNQYFLMSSN